MKCAASLASGLLLCVLASACRVPPSGPPGSGRLAQVDGRVVDGLGAAVPGIRVRVGSQEVATDDAGAFHLVDVAVPFDVWVLPSPPREDNMLFSGVTTPHPVLPLDPLAPPATDPTGQPYDVQVTTTGGAAGPSGANRLTTLDIVGDTVGAAPRIDTPDVSGTFAVPGFNLPRETSFDVVAYRGIWDEATGESTFERGAVARAPVVGSKAQTSLALVPLVNTPLTVSVTGFSGSWSLWRYWLFDGRHPQTLGLPLVQSTGARQVQMPAFTAGAPAISVTSGGTTADGGFTEALMAVPPGATDVSVALLRIPALEVVGDTLSLGGEIRWSRPKDSVCALTVGPVQGSYQVTAVTTTTHLSLTSLGLAGQAHSGDLLVVDLLCLGDYGSLDAALTDPAFALRYGDRLPNRRSQILPAQYTLTP